MKSDLRALMERDHLDAIWIQGAASHNPSMTYFTGSAHLGRGDLIIKRGEAPVLFCISMEREEAESTGLDTVITEKYHPLKILEEVKGDSRKAEAVMRQRMFQELNITSGKVALYGKVEVGGVLGILEHLKELLPDLEFIGAGSGSTLLEVRATKDEEEVERIRRMGQITTTVVGRTARFLQASPVGDDQVLLRQDGKPLTVGDIHRKINLWLAGEGVENPHGCIFAIGRDAGIPHSAGTFQDPIQLGKTIIFDIYPQEAGGGYFYDFTRTWCLGYAPDPVWKLYRDVKSVFDQIMDELVADQPATNFQDRTCELFEALDHKTIRQDNELVSGYVHSLGHGLGLDVHERPSFRTGSDDRLVAGSVVTIEPGLYYPEQGMGCRLEDSVYVRPDGSLEILADFPYDLVLPMEEWQE